MSSYDIIRSVFDSIGCDYNENTYLSACTSFRIGGKADFFVVPDSVEMLLSVVSACRENGIRYFILGKGSNLLVADDGFRGVVISTSGLDKIELIDDPIKPVLPSSPNIPRSTIVGFIVGVILSCALFVFIDMMDKKIKNLEDITNQFNIPILGVVPDTAPETANKKQKND